MKRQQQTSFQIAVTTPLKCRFLGNLTVTIQAYDYAPGERDGSRYGADIESVIFEDKDGQTYGELKALFDLLEDAGCLDIMDLIQTRSVARAQECFEYSEQATEAHYNTAAEMPGFDPFAVLPQLLKTIKD